MKYDYSNLSPLCKKILYISRYKYNFFLNKRNVVGVGLGYKEKNNIDTSMPCIKVFVEKKYSSEHLGNEEAVPEFYNGIITDVAESGRNELSSLRDRVRPAPGGYSTSEVVLGKSGTIGCLVTDGKCNYMLSCNHVFAMINHIQIGGAILQPGKSDGGKYATDKIAGLYKFIPLVPKDQGVNLVDCAIAKPINATDVIPAIALIGGIKGVRAAQLGEDVKKTGRTTELTEGKVKAIGCTIKTPIFSKDYIFSEQTITTKMSQEGDSGSVLMGKDNYALGLLYSGNTTQSIFNTMRNVIGNLRTTVVTS